MSDQEKAYLGDGLYVLFDGWQLALIADLGSPMERSVYLAPGTGKAARRSSTMASLRSLLTREESA